MLTSIEITSDAGSDDTYAIGDDIVATVTFDRTLQVDTGNGSPALTLTIGNGTGDATCALATDTKKLECTYTVVSDEEDTDGVSIGANRLALNGGRIHGMHGATGGDAELAHAALGSEGSHKVDGVRPTPANASVNGIALTLEWSETLDTGSAPAAGQFVLGVDSGTAPAVSSLTMSGTTMTLTLASAADATRGYTLAYTVPSSNPVKDLAGNEAVAFTGTGIETVQITWSFTLTSSRTDGAGNPLVVEGGATATATVSITNGVTTTVRAEGEAQMGWNGHRGRRRAGEAPDNRRSRRAHDHGTRGPGERERRHQRARGRALRSDPYGSVHRVTSRDADRERRPHADRRRRAAGHDDRGERVVGDV